MTHNPKQENFIFEMEKNHKIEPFFWCSRIQFLTSGGGSKAWKGDIEWLNPNEMKFYYDGQGFMSVQITQTRVDIAYYDIKGHVLHKWGTSKQLYANM